MDDYGLGRLLGYIQDKSYIGSGDAPYSGSPSRQENPIPEKGYEPVQGFVPGLADIAGAWASGSDLGMFYDMMGLQPVDGSPNLVQDLSVTLNIDPESIQKTLNDALAAAGLDQQGNPIQPEDPSINPLTVNPLLAQDAVNTGPFVTDPAIADVDDKETGVSSETAEQILAKYKDRAEPVTDMLGDYKQEDGSNFPVNVLLEIISDYAVNKDNKDAQVILGKWNDKVADTGSTPVGSTPQDQIGTPQIETNTPQGSTPTPQGGTPQGGTPTSDTPAGSQPPAGVQPPSSLEPTNTVNVDDKPKGFLTGMTPQAQAIINEGNRSDITERMLGPLIAKQDVPIISPLQIKLDNVKQSPLSTALLFSNGLMGSFV